MATPIKTGPLTVMRKVYLVVYSTGVIKEGGGRTDRNALVGGASLRKGSSLYHVTAPGSKV